jgi:serine/threonine protein kinase
MTPPAVQTFLSTLRKSNLLSPEQMAVANDLGHRSEAVVVAKDLTNRGWLTSWQARQILAGKSRLFLGKYRLLDVLGRGGMGAVLKAESTSLNQTVALKVMATDLLKSEVALARFEREIQYAASLNHPNIVRAIDADRVGNQYFLVMEYVDGRDLKEIFREHGRLPIEFSCECIRQTALALQHAHKRGLVHRDIKPSNIIVAKNTQNGQPIVKLIDLGLARIEQDETATDDSITRSGQIMGSPDYMAPEQATNAKNADIRSDIYSLGVALFQLISGDVPYPGDTVMEKLVARINTDAPPLSSRREDVPPVLVHIVARMLNRDPAQRFQTPGEVAALLEAFVTNPESLSIDQFAPATPKEAPNIDSGADDTLNLFVGHLETRARNQPLRSSLCKKPLWPLVVSIVAALVVVGGVLFALSKQAGPRIRPSRTAKQSAMNSLSQTVPLERNPSEQRNSPIENTPRRSSIATSPLKKGADPLEGVEKQGKTGRPERVRPLFQRTATG